MLYFWKYANYVLYIIKICFEMTLVFLFTKGSIAKFVKTIFYWFRYGSSLKWTRIG